MKSSLLRKVVIGTFLSVPAISSIISTIHLIDLFNLGNPTWLSILLAVTFELGSIASLLAISVIERIKVGAIWFIFFILSALQIIGNVYYTYSFTSNELLANPTFLSNFLDLFSFITGEEMKDAKIFLSCIIGIPIPLIALFFLKSNIDYLKPEPKADPAQNIPSPSAPNEVATVYQEPEPVIETVEQAVSIEASPLFEEVPDEQEQIEVQQDIDGSEDDHVILNPDHEDSYVEEPQTEEEPSIEEEPMQQFEQQEVNSQVVKSKQTGRSPRPMISQRRSDSVSVLHRG